MSQVLQSHTTGGRRIADRIYFIFFSPSSFFSVWIELTEEDAASIDLMVGRLSFLYQKE